MSKDERTPDVSATSPQPDSTSPISDQFISQSWTRSVELAHDRPDAHYV